MCTVLLPPGVNQIAVNKYIISYIFFLDFQAVSDTDVCMSKNRPRVAGPRIKQL